MFIRTFVVKIASEDCVTQKDIEGCLQHGLELLPGASEFEFNMSEERRSLVDKGIDAQGTLEENDRWIRLAVKEMES